jgi:TRAP-type C4-dicarboxylate transport system permease small subunit
MEKKGIKILEDVLIAISAAVVGLDLIFIFGAVLCRLLGFAFSFLEEYPRLLSSLIAFLGVAGLLRGGRHINVEFLPTRLKGRALARLEIILFLCSAVAAGFLLIASTEAMLYLRQLGEVSVSEIEIPIWWIYLSQVFGFALLLFASLELTVARIRFLFTSKKETAQIIR